ncbi:twin transmembrane helix small protein [Piscinibacterium candidicorallinum]|jgi:hypothetical protein|uniref:Twin transmembrane helix small protein n=1 Tax=Piscinibacterium candidicorallinum TaxID=1793872 RepID=A0ABV7H981_9BURK
MKFLVLLAFIGILASLASAGLFMLRRKGEAHQMVRALSWRIGLSIALFSFILFSWWMGWIQPTGIRVPVQ